MTNLTIMEFENEELEPSDIVVTMTATAMNQHGRDEFNITIKINGCEYFDSSRVSMDFEIYHPIINNYLLKTSERVQRGSSFILSGNLEKVNRIQVTYLSFINLFNSSSGSRTVTTSNTVEATREIMS